MTDEPRPADLPESGNIPDPFDGPEWAPQPFAAEPRGPMTQGTKGLRIKVSRRKRRTLRRRRRIGLGMTIIGGLILIAGLWVVITGLMARSQLNQVRADIHRLHTQIAAGDLTGARQTAADLATHAHRAHELTTGPAWALAAAIPSGGEPLRTIRGVTASVDQLGRDALPRLVSASDALDPTTLRSANGTIDLARIAATAPELDHAAAAMSQATSSVAGLPAHTWLATIDSARNDVLSQLNSLTHTVRTADLAARIAPAMLGQHGPKSYLISFQNEAELRGTGGLPGAFAIVKADHGKLTFTRFESDATLVGVPSGLNLGTEFDQLYSGDRATQDYNDSNVSANFPYAARIWIAMWHQYSGQTLDGAMAVDPTALSYLLTVTGPVTLPDKSTISAANVVQQTQNTAYLKFATDDPARKAYLLDLARAVSTHLIDSTSNTTALVKAAGQAASERRLMLWSADAAVEAQLAQSSLGGAVVATKAPYAGLSLNNAAANKLDYYLDASLAWQRTGCGATSEVTATITISNTAPAGLPASITGNFTQGAFPAHRGDNRTVVGYYATSGAQLTSITLNGSPIAAQSGSENGHPVFSYLLVLPRGVPQTLVLHMTEPAGTGSPIVLRQPMVNPLAVTVQDAHCN